jgi:hypothetical protein
MGDQHIRHTDSGDVSVAKPPTATSGSPRNGHGQRSFLETPLQERLPVRISL